MKLKTVLLGLTAAAVSTGVAFAQMQPIPNPPEKPKPAASVHHAKKTHAKKTKKTTTTPAAASKAAPAADGAK
jgi:hypothetical protein